MVLSNPIMDDQDVLDSVYAELFPTDPVKPAIFPLGGKSTPSLTDSDIVMRASNAANGAKFRALFAGRTSGYDSASEADAALAMLIGFWTDDKAQIERVMRQSNLVRAKWDERRGNGTYLSTTIENASRKVTERYSPRNVTPIGVILPTNEAASQSQSYIEQGIGIGTEPLATALQGPSLLKIVNVWEEDEPEPRRFIIERLAPEGAITCLYGDGGLGKSYLSLYAGMCVCSGRSFAGLATVESAVLYVDGELDSDEFVRRAYALARGMGISHPPKGLYYVQLPGPLSERPAQELIKTVVAATEAKFIVLDSLTMSTYGGDPSDPQAVIRVMKYLETLGTVLAIDHIGKTMTGVNLSNYTQFGSAFKRHAARSQVQVVRADGGGLTLLHKKTNFGVPSAPINLALEFDGEQVRVKSIDAGDDRLAGIEDNLPAIEQVFHKLASVGIARPGWLSTETGKDEKTVKNYLTALHKTRRCEPVGDGTWRVGWSGPNPNPNDSMELGFGTDDYDDGETPF